MPTYLVWDHDCETAEDATYLIDSPCAEAAIKEFAEEMDDRGERHTIRARESLRDTIHEATVTITLEPVVRIVDTKIVS